MTKVSGKKKSDSFIQQEKQQQHHHQQDKISTESFILLNDIETQPLRLFKLTVSIGYFDA